jgi:hypothetical protein
MENSHKRLKLDSMTIRYYVKKRAIAIKSLDLYGSSPYGEEIIVWGRVTQLNPYRFFESKKYVKIEDDACIENKEGNISMVLKPRLFHELFVVVDI